MLKNWGIESVFCTKKIWRTIEDKLLKCVYTIQSTYPENTNFLFYLSVSFTKWFQGKFPLLHHLIFFHALHTSVLKWCSYRVLLLTMWAGGEKRTKSQMTTLNWMQQQFSETLSVTGRCSVEYLQNFHFQDCFHCWNILPEWNTWLNYYISNFLIQDQTSICLCVASKVQFVQRRKEWAMCIAPYSCHSVRRQWMFCFSTAEKKYVKKYNCTPFVRSRSCCFPPIPKGK